jgi:hypothetical protein
MLLLGNPYTFATLSTNIRANPSCVKPSWVGTMIVYFVSLLTMTRIAVNFNSPDRGNPVIRSKETVAKGHLGM